MSAPAASSYQIILDKLLHARTAPAPLPPTPAAPRTPTDPVRSRASKSPRRPNPQAPPRKPNPVRVFGTLPLAATEISRSHKLEPPRNRPSNRAAATGYERSLPPHGRVVWHQSIRHTAYASFRFVKARGSKGLGSTDRREAGAERAGTQGKNGCADTSNSTPTSQGLRLDDSEPSRLYTAVNRRHPGLLATT